MIMVGMLDMHSSSPTSIFGDLAALAKRHDLYSGDDFYFGFTSSNHTFLDIIGGQQPLAIKYGPIFSIYRQDSVAGYLCETYYIDVKTRALLPIINIAAKPLAAGVFKRLLLWSFTDFYGQAADPSVQMDKPKESSIDHEEMIPSVIEQLAKSRWPDDDKLNLLSEAVDKVLSCQDGIQITLADLRELKRQMHVECQPPTVYDFVAPYNPFYGSVDLDVDSILKLNTTRITVRQVGDTYPRIEVIIPGLSEQYYAAVYKRTEPDLYQALQDALAVPTVISGLIWEHFPALVQPYFSKNKIDLPPEKTLAYNVSL